MNSLMVTDNLSNQIVQTPEQLSFDE